VTLLQGLRERGALVVALTNTNRIHHRIWSQRYVDALTVFDTIHSSHDLRARKPEPSAFMAVLDAHHLEPAEAVFIDDSPGHVEAACEVGLHGIVFTDADRLAEQLRDLPWSRSAAD
jgi:putative hydrolase of the HAD superfamily